MKEPFCDSFLWLYFRIGELVQNSITDIGHAVQLQDITFNTDNKSVVIKLKHSKTDQEGRGAVVNIKSVDKHLCPVFLFANSLD